MSDLIDRKLALWAIYRLGGGERRVKMAAGTGPALNPYDDGIYSAAKEIEKLPRFEIIRCKECKHKVVNELGWTVCEMESADPYEHTRDVDNDNWFCADGERREDETD